MQAPGARRRAPIQPIVGKALCLLFVTGIGPLARKNFEADGRRWWAHVQYLASDGMQGRGVGSSGFDAAADYVAAQFQKAGLRPGGIDNYFQPVNLIQLTLDESDSSLQLIEDRKTVEVKLGADAILGLSPDASAHVEAPLVFAGYGLKIPEAASKSSG
jgi:hypothetical protein